MTMKKSGLFGLLLLCCLLPKGLGAQEDKDLSKVYEVATPFRPLSADANSDFNNMVYYHFGWNRKGPAVIALQFVNMGYKDHKLKFAIKDLTAKKLVVLDPARRSNFGTEALKADSKGAIWTGAVKNIRDKFSLHAWEDGGDEMDKDPVSINDKK
jgi:hypothetical protein